MKFKLTSDSIQGSKSVIYLDGQKVNDVSALQINMTPMGLNTVVLQRTMEGAEVTMDLYGGEAFQALRGAALALLARWHEVSLPPDQLLVFFPLCDALRRLRDAVEAVQEEVAG